MHFSDTSTCTCMRAKTVHGYWPYIPAVVNVAGEGMAELICEHSATLMGCMAGWG